MRSRVRVSQRPPFLLLSGVIRLHDDAFLFRAISRSIREFCKARSSPRLSTEILFSCLRHAIRGPSPPKFSVFVKSRLHGFLNSRWRTALILAKQPKIQKQRVSPFSKFCRVKMDLTSKYREEVALILIKAGVEYLETTVTCLHFSAMATSGMARKRNPAIFPNRQNGR